MCSDCNNNNTPSVDNTELECEMILDSKCVKVKYPFVYDEVKVAPNLYDFFEMYEKVILELRRNDLVMTKDIKSLLLGKANVDGSNIDPVVWRKLLGYDFNTPEGLDTVKELIRQLSIIRGQIEDLNNNLGSKADINASNILVQQWKEKLDITDERFNNYYTKINVNNGREYVLKIDGTAIEVSSLKPRTFKYDFGNGIDNEFIISHNMGSDVIVQVIDTITNEYKTVDISIIDKNKLKIKTTDKPGINTYKVLIVEL